MALIACIAISIRAEDVVKGKVGKRVDEYLTRLASFGLSGAVLVTKRDEVLLKKGYGSLAGETVDDIINPLLALDNNRLVSAVTRRKTTVVSHNFVDGLNSAAVRRYVDERVVIIAFTNHPAVSASLLASAELESLVFNDRPVVMPPRIIDLARIPSSRLREAAGRYPLPNGFIVQVTQMGERLYVHANHPQVLAALLGLSFATRRGRFAEVESRTRVALESAAKGDYKPIFETFDDDRPFEEVVAAQRRVWTRWDSEFGALLGVDVLGTVLEQGNPTVAVQLRFSRRAPLLYLRWNPRGMFAARMTTAPQVVIRPESTDTYASFAYGQAAPVRFTFRDRTVRITGHSLAFSGQK